MLNPAFCHPYTFWVLSRMASIESRQEGPVHTEDKDDDCHGHGCYRTDCCQGYRDHIQGRHDRNNQGQVSRKDYAKLRYPYYRWRLRK